MPLFLLSTLFSEETLRLSLTQSEKLALSNNKQIQEIESLVEKARFGYLISISDWLPKLELMSQAFQTQHDQIGSSNNKSSFLTQLLLTQTLFSASKYYNLQITNLVYKELEWIKLGILNDILYDIRNAYYKIILDKNQIETAAIHVEVLKALADTVLAKSKVQLINTYLSHTLIYAPFDGVIAKRWIFTGDVMRPGQSLFTMYDRQRVWVQANLSEKKIKKVKMGDPVEILVDAYPNKTFYGKVFTIKSAAASQFSVIPQNNATGNYTKVAQRIPIKITLDSPSPDSQLYLFPGMNVEVKIKIQGN